VTDFGAVGNNVTEDTHAVQQAVDQCTTVVFPAGVFLIRPINMSHSNLELQFHTGATVVAWGDLRTWTNSTGSAPYPRHLFYTTTRMITGLTLRGVIDNGATRAPSDGGVGAVAEGRNVLPTIDGQGWRWWPYGKTIKRPALFAPFGARLAD
jgi:polygalacturonase